MLLTKRQLNAIVISGLAASMLLSACAKKSYVRQQVDAKTAPIDKKVTDLTASVKDNAERIDAVDRRAQQGITDAAAARTAANTAQTAATAANTAATTAQTAATRAQTTADGANQAAQTAANRVTTVDSRVTALAGTLDRFTPGPVTSVQFKVGKAVLTDEAKATLDGIASSVANQQAGYRVEIQGFASAEGAEAANLRLSQQRAENVQRYLVSKGVALIRVSLIGMGTDKPVGDNKTKAGKEQNRRVEVRVFKAAS
jgi:outer membrane protein OmpA-like peptidoglycan-associated protein